MDGRCEGGYARHYGTAAPTSNVAEAGALVDGLHWVLETRQAHIANGRPVVVRGDSQLTISFMLRRAQPAKRELVLAI